MKFKRGVRSLIVVVSCALLVLVSLHIWNLLRDVPKYYTEPLNSDEVHNYNNLTGITNNDLISKFSTTKLMDANHRYLLPEKDELTLRLGFFKKSTFWPRKLDKIEILNSNEIWVSLSAKSGGVSEVWFATREHGEWVIWH